MQVGKQRKNEEHFYMKNGIKTQIKEYITVIVETDASHISVTNTKEI